MQTAERGLVCGRLSYKGLGEPICFFTFGPLAMSSFFRTQVATLNCCMRRAES